MNPFQNRRSIVVAAVILVFAVMAFRLFQVQIIKKEYRVTAENNALKYENWSRNAGLSMTATAKSWWTTN